MLDYHIAALSVALSPKIAQIITLIDHDNSNPLLTLIEEIGRYYESRINDRLVRIISSHTNLKQLSAD